MNAKTLSPTQKLITTNTGSQYIINSGVYVTTPQAPINPSTLEDCFLDTSDVGALNELKSNLDKESHYVEEENSDNFIVEYASEAAFENAPRSGTGC